MSGLTARLTSGPAFLMGGNKTITIAWTEEVWRATESADSVRIDLGVRVKGEMTRTAYSLVWLLNGTPDDVVRAEAWAATQGGSHLVETWPLDISDPLTAARESILKRSP